MGLPCLDVVFGLTVRGIKLFVKMLAAAALEIGDDVAGIAPHCRRARQYRYRYGWTPGRAQTMLRGFKAGCGPFNPHDGGVQTGRAAKVFGRVRPLISTQGRTLRSELQHLVGNPQPRSTPLVDHKGDLVGIGRRDR